MRRFSHIAGMAMAETIVLLLMLGVALAFIVPRLFSVKSDSRQAIMESLAASMRGSAALAYSLSYPDKDATSVKMNGAKVMLANNFPAATADGIVQTVTSTIGFDVAYLRNKAVFHIPEMLNSHTCQVIYTQSLAKGEAPDIEIDVSDCSH